MMKLRVSAEEIETKEKDRREKGSQVKGPKTLQANSSKKGKKKKREQVGRGTAAYMRETQRQECASYVSNRQSFKVVGGIERVSWPAGYG